MPRTAAKARAVAPPPDGGYPGGNTAEGQNALLSLTLGTYNTAVGWYSLGSNTTGQFNAATGAAALFSNTSGQLNTANGIAALFSNTIGAGNTANGSVALFSNTSGSQNTATGIQALLNNTSGINNTANGVFALYTSNGSWNTAIGMYSLYGNTTGSENTANGYAALQSNTSGSQNTAIGQGALANNTTGQQNIALGAIAGNLLTTGSSNIDIANQGVAGESATIRIGSGFQTKTFIAGIRGVTTGNTDTVPVVIDPFGQLGTISSSRRFKKEIKPMDKTSEAVLALKPVTFHYNTDKTSTSQFGLIAEEVAEVNPDLVVRDEKGEIYTVRYDAVNAMVLNEFLKEHRRVQRLEATVAQQQKDFQAAIAKLHETVAAQIQELSAQLEMTKPAPQTVLNN